MRRKIRVLCMALLLLNSSYSQTRMPLYKEGMVPNAISTHVLFDTLPWKSWLTGRDTMVALPKTIMPTLTVFAPPADKAKGVGVIICSGGSYAQVADGWEGYPAAKALSSAGITAFVLHYRVPRSDLMINKETGPQQDLQEAIKFVREHAQQYRLQENKIGIMGFSAGGHLVSTIGTHLDSCYTVNEHKTSLRPDFMVLVYPVISFADTLTDSLTRTNLIGPDIKSDKVRLYSNELQVTERTPPVFLVHAVDDKIVKVENSLYFAAALEQHKVPVQLFLYNKGGHGFGVENKTAEQQWLTPCIDWILYSK